MNKDDSRVGDLSELSSKTLCRWPSNHGDKPSINFASRIFNDVANGKIMSFLFRPYICSRCALRSANSRHLEFSRISIRPCRRYSKNPAIHDDRPFRFAVIGSGPAGFYTAYKVMAKIENATVDMYEHLPVPYGLVRFGVAPDHPEVKVWEPASGELDRPQHVHRTAKTSFVK